MWHAAVPEARRLVATHRGVVRAIGFDDADQPTQMLLLLGEGELTLWRLPAGRAAHRAHLLISRTEGRAREQEAS